MVRKRIKIRKPLPIIFDTSILSGLRPNDLSPEFRLLQRLAENRKVILQVPEIAFREWLSQRIEPAAQAMDNFEAALNKIQRLPSIAEQPEVKAIAESTLHTPEIFKRIRQTLSEWHKDQLDRLHLSIVQSEPADAAAVFDSYFSGNAPFSGKKARKDFPDAFVFAAVVRAFNANPSTVFVCNDNRLRKAAEAQGVTVAASLLDLLKLKSLAALHTNPMFALWWEENISTIVAKLQAQQNALRDLMENQLIDSITNISIEHWTIPEDNNEATVVFASITDFEINWEKAESLGEGVLTIPVRFEAELELEFYVFRSDAFSVPKWVDVSIGDFEEDHYFEASGSRVGKYTARLVIGIDDDIVDGDVDLSAADVTVEDVEFEGLEGED